MLNSKRFLIFCIPFILVLACGSAHAYTLATSIRPLYGIAAAIAGNEAEVTLLLDTAVSPHDASVRPSHILKIRQADAILMINRDFEKFLQRPLETYADKRPIIEASSAPGVQVLSRQILKANPTSDWRVQPKTLKDITGEENPKDYHLWLDPQNAIKIAHQVHGIMVQAEPKHKEAFDRHLADFEQQVNEIANRMQVDLGGSSKRFIAAHDGFQYFTRAFSISEVGTLEESITNQTDPARRLFLQKQAVAPTTACIIQDTDSKNRDAEQLSKQSKKPLLTADPLGQNLPLNAQLYPALLQRMGVVFADCLNH